MANPEKLTLDALSARIAEGLAARQPALIFDFDCSDIVFDAFKKDPEKTVERVAGTDVPDGWLEKIIEGVKAALSADKIKETVGNIGEKLGGLFKKDE